MYYTPIFNLGRKVPTCCLRWKSYFQILWLFFEIIDCVSRAIELGSSGLVNIYAELFDTEAWNHFLSFPLYNADSLMEHK